MSSESCDIKELTGICAPSIFSTFSSCCKQKSLLMRGIPVSQSSSTSSTVIPPGPASLREMML